MTVAVMGCLCAGLRAETPAKNNAAPQSSAAPKETLNQYGKILLPGDDVAHPMKLKLPLPGAGEVKVPTPDELGMREKLEQLAKLSDDEIHAQLEQWPAFKKMSLRDQGQMLARIQDFRDYRMRTALVKAHDMGLTLTMDQRPKFEKDYWDKRFQMDHDLVAQLGPIFQARQKKMEDELFRAYFTPPPAPPIAQAPKPPLTPSVPIAAGATNKGPQVGVPATNAAPKAPQLIDAKK